VSPPARLRRRLALCLLAAVTCLGVALVNPAGARADVRSTGATPAHHGEDQHGGEAAWIRRTMQRMSVEEKVGQLLVTYAYGTTADTTDPTDVKLNREDASVGVDNAAQLIAKYHLGGVIYFAWAHNVNDPQQIAHLSNGNQRAAREQGAHVPLLISTDQEQGVVVRVGPPATQFPGNMALGADGNPRDARTAAAITGSELRAIGINQDFAPVSDVNVNAANPVIGVRSFGADPQAVAGLASAQVDGYQRDAGIAATAKHFPGHGDTDVDSHTGIPIITHTRAQWQTIDQPPFAADVAHGIQAIMTAHIIVPSLDPSGDPATLSHPIITGILRNEMHFDGVVITDALTMAGVRAKYGDDRVPVLALKAGVDQLLMPPNIDVAYNSVLSAVRSGELSMARIDQSVARVLRLKYRLGVVKDPFVRESRVDRTVGTPQHLAAAQQITDRTTTLVKNDAKALPLAADASKHVLVTGWSTTIVPGGPDSTHSLAAKIAARGLQTSAFSTGSAPSQATIDSAVARAKANDVTIVLTNNAATSGSQQRLVKALLASGKPVVVAAVRNPYDIAYFTDAPTYLATYSYTDVSLESLARALLGERAPTGKLPVAIPVAGSPGSTLYPLGYGLSY
jgi:beta-N-acetylhexosaminidase